MFLPGGDRGRERSGPDLRRQPILRLHPQQPQPGRESGQHLYFSAQLFTKHNCAIVIVSVYIL